MAGKSYGWCFCCSDPGIICRNLILPITRFPVIMMLLWKRDNTILSAVKTC